MSRIDDLVERLCPNGVSIRTLADLGTIQRGRRFVKADIVGSGVPCIHYGEIYTSYGVSATVPFSYLRPDQAARLRTARPGDVIIASAGETVEDIGKAVAWLGEEDVVIHDACYAFRSPLDPKYVAYFFQTADFHSQIRRSISSSKISAISIENLGKVLIPVPPVEVQREVVRVLDLFTTLEAELEAELEARRTQYAQYRGLLATAPGADTQWARLGEIASVRVGQAPPEGVVAESGPFAFVNAGTSESGRAVEANTSGGAVTIPSRGQGGVGVVGFQTDDFWCGPLCYRIVSTHDGLRTRYLYHYLKSVQPSIRGLQQAGGTPALNRKELVLVRVPMPSLDAQERIVTILDAFDALVNDLSIGLPAELNARRKQYEHYRDRLLTFKELAA